MGPYFGLMSLTYWKNGLPERANWKRFPTMGQPGGPGGRLIFFDELVLRDSKTMRPDMMKAKAVKKTW